MTFVHMYVSAINQCIFFWLTSSVKELDVHSTCHLWKYAVLHGIRQRISIIFHRNYFLNVVLLETRLQNHVVMCRSLLRPPRNDIPCAVVLSLAILK